MLQVMFIKSFIEELIHLLSPGIESVVELFIAVFVGFAATTALLVTLGSS